MAAISICSTSILPGQLTEGPETSIICSVGRAGKGVGRGTLLNLNWLTSAMCSSDGGLMGTWNGKKGKGHLEVIKK